MTDSSESKVWPVMGLTSLWVSEVAVREEGETWNPRVMRRPEANP